ERRVFGLTVQRLRNIDEFRHAIERMAPVDYLGASYYERWLSGTLRLLVEKGVITHEALERRMAQLARYIEPTAPTRSTSRWAPHGEEPGKRDRNVTSELLRASNRASFRAYAGSPSARVDKNRARQPRHFSEVSSLS